MPTSNQYAPLVATDLAATIAGGQTTSPEIDLAGAALCGLFLPAAFTGAALKLLASPNPGGTYVAVQDGAGADLSLAVAASKYIPLPNLALVAGLRFIKLVSGASEAADRSIVLAVRPV